MYKYVVLEHGKYKLSSATLRSFPRPQRSSSDRIDRQEETMPEIGELLREIEGLNQAQVRLLTDMARSMKSRIVVSVNHSSDILTDDFLADFTNRLCLYHVMHVEKLNKKAFEYLFLKSSLAAGRISKLVDDPTNPGEDIVVDGVGYSLKTEASQSIREGSITISKLMEARWIRDCRDGNEFARETRRRIVEHLSKYTRMIILRGFGIDSSAIRYDMVEVPLEILRRVGQLIPRDFSNRTPSGGSSADVNVDEKKAFSLRLDGSVEKITISLLRTDLCFTHGSWVIPVQLSP